MLFNSIEFLIFFPIVTLLFYLMPQKWRWLLLLAASCFFYMWFIPKYIFILLITILIDYSAGILIEKWKDDISKKKAYLVVSIVSTCMVLFIFKYLNFCSANLVALAQHLGWSHPQKILNIALPIGLSFHTFQSLSYVIEVYRGNQKAERHFGYYALYVMFYPQLVTGPNGNTMFLPAAGNRQKLHHCDAGMGYYLSRTLKSDQPGFACGLYLGPAGWLWGYGPREYGQIVRAVRVSQN